MGGRIGLGDCLLGFLLVCCFAQVSVSGLESPLFHAGRRLSALVPSTPLVLQYHKGPLLTGPGSINAYILWYGNFSLAQKTPISDFFASLQVTNFGQQSKPSVSSWWATLQGYKDSSKASIAGSVRIAKQASDASYSLGKTLKRIHIALLVRRALVKRLLPIDLKGIYLVFTADDVFVERFCMNSCGFHDTISLSERTKVLLAWVGNSGVQCPGQCAWPFAAPLYGPPTPPLLPPNGDVGIDGMIINIATILAGTVSNPFNTGYYQGDALAPLEAATACTGIFGKGAYPGYPGDLLVDKITKASYNAYGINRRAFLLPAIWNPSTLSCKTPLS